SVVKRICGEDSEGVAPCENSSVPGPFSVNALCPSRRSAFIGYYFIVYAQLSCTSDYLLVIILLILNSLLMEYVRRIIHSKQKVQFLA
ncbi:MAG: hypothetical protein AAGI69_20465, partial [Cyanobacteria bacterium P01_H01_bin.21]